MNQAVGSRALEILRAMHSSGFRVAVVYEIGFPPDAGREMSIRSQFPSSHYRRIDLRPETGSTSPGNAAENGNGHGTSAGLTTNAKNGHSPGKPDSAPPDVAFIDLRDGCGDLGPLMDLVREAKILFVDVQFLPQSSTTRFQQLTELVQPLGISLLELGEFQHDTKGRLCSAVGVFASESLPAEAWSAATESMREETAPPPAGRIPELIRKLKTLTADLAREGMERDRETDTGKLHPVLQNADLIVSHFEVNRKHGVGVLLDRFFGASPNIISLRSRDYYGGKQKFGVWSAQVSHSKKTRDAVFSEVLDTFGDTTVQRILCVPFFPDDVRTAIAAREIFGVPMCSHIMDDQNVYAGAINDALIAELLKKSSLRLAISPEVRAAYQQKYGMPMWFMPPLASAEWIPVGCKVCRTRRQSIRWS